MNLRNKLLAKRIVTGFITLVVFTASSLAYVSPAMAWTYQIQQGDSLYKISKRYGSNVNQLSNNNQLKSDLILSGDKISIPDNEVKPMQNSRGQDDLYLLARLISGEARGESYLGQVAVGAVIMNRLGTKDFPQTIAGNVFKAGEFESVSNGQIWGPIAPSALTAAKAAISGQDPTGGALYFYNPSKVYSPYNWIWNRLVTGQIGQHVFAI